ncbi:MAG: hypothetical protein ACFFA0_07615 [Promethearchaeota archaeon]
MAASIYKTQGSINYSRFTTNTPYLFPKRRAAVSIFGTLTVYLPNALKEIKGNVDKLADELDKLFLTEFVCLCASGSAVVPLCEKLNNCPVVKIIEEMREIKN